MGSNKLTVLENTLPLKAYPEKDLDTLLETQFKFWLSALLSIKKENEQKVDLALPAIKKHCWSMGLDKVKKMFEMYIDGELNITPISNHLDRILVGQIFQEYKKTQRTKPKQTMNEAEYKLIQDKLDAISHFDYFLNSNKLDPNSQWVYTYLESRGLIQDDKKTKILAFNLAKEVPHIQNDEQAKIYAKKHLLRRYFERLQAKDKHLKDLL